MQGDNDDFAGARRNFKTDHTIIGTHYIFQLGELAVGQHMRERGVRIIFFVCRGDRFRGNALHKIGINRCQDAPFYGQQVRREEQADILPGKLRQLFLDFGSMPVQGHGISFEIAGSLAIGKSKLLLPASPVTPDFASITIPFSQISPSLRSGASARILVVV